MPLKTNFHLHTSDDPKDNIFYSAYDAIDCATKLNFEVIAFTCHQKFTHKKDYEDYAQKKNILLVSGIEAKIEGKHVIVLNCNKSIEMVKTFKELRTYRRSNSNIFIIAPHPFVPFFTRPSLGKKLEQNIDLFDAIELSLFSNKIFNFNKKAKKIAEKYKKPFIATSDTHNLNHLNQNYTLINAKEKTPTSIFNAIKQKTFQNKTKEMSPFSMVKHVSSSYLRHARNLIK